MLAANAWRSQAQWHFQLISYGDGSKNSTVAFASIRLTRPQSFSPKNNMTTTVPTLAFDYVPPNLQDVDGREQIQRLFYNREADINIGMRLLRRLFSNGGEQKIWAIQGDSRLGKSHYARLLLCKLAAEQPSIKWDGPQQGVFVINANLLKTAIDILVEIHTHIWKLLNDQFDTEILAKAAPEELERIRRYQETLDDAHTRLINPSVTSARKRGNVRTGGSGAAAKVGVDVQVPGIGKLGAEGSGTLNRSDSETNEEVWNYLQLTDREVISLVSEAFDILAELHGSHTPFPIFLIDDLDLVGSTRGGSATTGSERDRIFDYLGRVLGAAKSRPIVLITSRVLETQASNRAISKVVLLRELEDIDLRAVCSLRCEYYFSGQQVFSEPALAWLLRHAKGQVGVFLRQCDGFYRHFEDRCDLPLSEANLYEWMRADLSRHLKSDEIGIHMRNVLASIDAHQGKPVPYLEIKEERDDMEIRDSELLHQWLHPIGRSRYEIDPEYIEAIRTKRLLPQ